MEPSPEDPIVPAPSEVEAAGVLRAVELRDDEEVEDENREVAARNAGELEGGVPATLDDDELVPLWPEPEEVVDEAVPPEEEELEELADVPPEEDELPEDVELAPVRPAEVLTWLINCPVPARPPRNWGAIRTA